MMGSMKKKRDGVEEVPENPGTLRRAFAATIALWLVVAALCALEAPPAGAAAALATGSPSTGTSATDSPVASTAADSSAAQGTGTGTGTGTSTSTSTSTGKSTGTSAARPLGAWRWPTGNPVPVLRAFDPPAMPWLSGHRGVDLGAASGSLVFAPAPGHVIFAGMVAGRPVVSVMHQGGLRSTYEPVSSDLSPGTTVGTGQAIGTLEPGHDHDALHWGARFEKNEYIDPLRLLSGPSVLKPWD